MRVVGGRLKGRNLASPSGREIRPTADRLRESVFNILVHAYDNPIEDARVLDLFAGTGALGIEAASRGARFTLFVDNGAEARALLRNNVVFIQSEKGPASRKEASFSGRTLLDIASCGVQKLCRRIMGLPRQHKAHWIVVAAALTVLVAPCFLPTSNPSRRERPALPPAPKEQPPRKLSGKRTA